MWLLICTSAFCILAVLVWLIPRSQDFHSAIEGKTVLLVTAHPDDECMFFAPTLLSIAATSNTKVVLLCLSIGDYYSQGIVRRLELTKSASVLGVHGDNVVLIDDESLPDSPSVEWDCELVGEYVHRTLSQHRANVIITFDDLGVSGHPNHISVSRAMRALKNKGKLQSEAGDAIQVLLLETTNLLRKYSSCLDWFPGLCLARYQTACDLNGYFKGRQAMKEHRSQYIWFRQLYIIFSRYMYINTFKEL
ncbi:N-acetylglucosaminyl-phosphatidylinositol de-N-acetylase-like isoform X2 [Halichondria panicea]|uniref:N-acetylglucosaminyl-phosphatidylinositol de-N-acetylase-like isoform X2 n=1 Tax=Halichondria panicea TaxID=6063 RepID=UPI00312B8FE6